MNLREGTKRRRRNQEDGLGRSSQAGRSQLGGTAAQSKGLGVPREPLRSLSPEAFNQQGNTEGKEDTDKKEEDRNAVFQELFEHNHAAKRMEHRQFRLM